MYQSEEYIHNRVPIKIFNHSFDGENIFTPMHWHRSVEFNLTTAGRIWRNISGNLIEQKADDWVIVNSGEVHSDHWIDKGDHFEGITVQISKSFIDFWLGESVQLKLPDSEEANRALVNQLKCFRMLHKEDENYGMEAMEQLFHFLILVKAHCIDTSAPVKSTMRREIEISGIKYILSYIDEHYQEELSLNIAAEAAGYSSAHLSRMFKEHIGQNFHEYLQNVRLASCVNTLKRNPNIKLTDCAMQNGFPNTKSFIQAFKKYFGCTPSEWLKQRKSAT